MFYFTSGFHHINPKELDNEALSFISFITLTLVPLLGSMLVNIYDNPLKDANQSRLKKMLQFWAFSEAYDNETMYSLVGAGLEKRILHIATIYWSNRHFFWL